VATFESGNRVSSASSELCGGHGVNSPAAEKRAFVMLDPAGVGEASVVSY